jgi:hypothetical protein
VGLRKRTQRTPEASARPRASAPPLDASTALTRRDEKIMLMLAIQTQQLNDRIARLEDRFEHILRDSMAQPDQQDLLELRLHSARLAAELSRVTIELRAEISELANDRGEVIDLTTIGDIDPIDGIDPSAHPSAGGLPHRRVDDLVSDARELAASRPRARRTSGWKPVRRAPAPDTDD